MSPSATSTGFLKTSRDGDSLDPLCQCFTTLSVKMMIHAATKRKTHQRQNLFTQIKSSPSPKWTAKQESFFFWNNTIKSWLKPTFHSEFSSTSFVTMRGDDQGKIVCSLYRKCAEVQWFDAEQQLCKQCNGRGSCSPASQIHPKHLFCCNTEKVTGTKTPMCCRERWCVSRYWLPCSHLWSQWVNCN